MVQVYKPADKTIGGKVKTRDIDESQLGAFSNAGFTVGTPPADVEPTVGEIKGEGTYSPKDTSALDRFETASAQPDQAALRADEQARIKAQIEALQRQADVERAVIAQESQQRTGRTRATSGRSGLLGSTFGASQATQTEQANQQQREQFEAQIGAQIASIQSNSEDRLSKKIEAERLYADTQYDKFQTERSNLRGEARTELIALGASGGTLDDLDPASKKLILEDTGMSEFAANAVMLANNPESNANYQVIGNKIVGYYFDPKSGSIKTMESESLPDLNEGDELQMVNGVPYVMSRDEEGNLQGKVLSGYSTDTSLSEGDKLDIDKKKLNIKKLEQEIENSTDDIDKQIKELELKKKQDELSGSVDEEPFKSVLATNGRQAVLTMLNLAKESPGIFGRTAAAYVPGALRTNAFRNYEAQLDALKGNIIPAALGAMRDASKTGGALGQVSDREGNWLAASLGALNMEQSPEQVVKQLKQIDEALTRWQVAVDEHNEANSLPEDTEEYSDLNWENIN